MFEESCKNTVKDFGLTTTEFELLATLRFAPYPHQLTPSKIYDALLMSSGGLTKVLKSLEDRELIFRSDCKADRRSRPIQLSDAGKRLIEEVMPAVQAKDDSMWKVFSPEKIEELCIVLKQLTESVERER